MTTPRHQMTRDLQIAGLSERTQEAYFGPCGSWPITNRLCST